jgi:hypothetical protein
MKSTSQPELWRQRYEALRQHVLNGGDTLGTAPLGLHLLHYQGVAGWMERWTEAVESSSVVTVTSPPPSLLCTVGWQQQLTVLLAQMTLQQIQPVSTP